jgi:hypothetical protein
VDIILIFSSCNIGMMSNDHNPYKLTPVQPRSSSAAPVSRSSASASEYQAIGPDDWRTLTKGTKISYERADGKVSSGYVNSVEGQVLRMYNKDYRTGKYINWDMQFSNIKRISIMAQPYMKQAASGPAQIIQESQPMQPMQVQQSPYQQQPMQAPQQVFMQPPTPSQMFSAGVDQSLLERKITELESKHNSRIIALEQELKKAKADLNEIVVYLTGLQTVLKSKGITR